MRPVLRAIASVSLDLAGNLWHALRGIGIDSLVNPRANWRSPCHLSSSHIRRTWRHHRRMDSDKMLGHRATSNVYCERYAGGDSTATRYARFESPGRNARRARVVGHPGQPGDVGADVPVRDVGRGLGTYFASRI